MLCPWPKLSRSKIAFSYFFLLNCSNYPNACANATALPTITRLIIIPTPPWFVNCCICPSQKTAKLTAPTSPPMMAIGRHHPGTNGARAIVKAAPRRLIPATTQSPVEIAFNDCVLTALPSSNETPFHSWNVTQNGDIRYTSPWKPITRAIRYLSQTYNFRLC